jgi:hypothetical protein
MPEPLGAQIRPYETKDSRFVRFMIGKANFGVLAVANNRGVYYTTSLFNPDSLMRNSSLHTPYDTRSMGCSILSICPIHELVA